MNGGNISRGIRFIAMILEFGMFILLIFPITKIVAFAPNTMLYLSTLAFAYFFCKDSINGQSFVKRIFKLQVIDIETRKPASPLKTFIRNLFAILWPIEVVAALSNPHRRIGDKVAKTELVKFNPENENTQPNYRQAALVFCSIYAVFIFAFWGFNTFLAGKEIARLSIDEITTSNDSIKAKEVSIDLKVGDKIYFWSDMNISYTDDIKLEFQIMTTIDTSRLGVINLDPFEGDVTMMETRTSFGGKTNWQFSKRLHYADITKAGRYTFKAMLTSPCVNCELILKKADLVIKK